MSTSQWEMPAERIDRVTQAFPALVIGTLMPEMKDIPEEFRERTSESAPWYRMVSLMLVGKLQDKMEGLRIKEALVEADKVEDGQAFVDRAFLHLGTLMGSYQPRHQHKEAAVAWLASLWFEEIIWKDPSRDA